MKNHYHIISALLLSSLTACSSLDTQVSIPEKNIPDSFPKQAKQTFTIANINWRDYFQDPQLIALMDATIKNNQDLQIALQRIDIARSSVKLANSALLPKVDLNIGGSLRKFGLYTMDGAGNATTEITGGQLVPRNLPDLYLGLQASWEIDVWDKLKNQRQSAIASYLGTIEGTNFVISNLVADVAVYYHELIALDNQLDIIRQTITKQKHALDIVQAQKEAARANELAVQQFKAQLLNTEILEKNTEQQIGELENKLNFLIGRYPQPIARAKDLLFKNLPKQLLTGIPSQLLANRPDIREAEQQITASQFDVLAAKAAFYPNFNITAALGFQAFNPQFLFTSPASIAYTVAGTIIAPLINKNALEAQFNTAKANQINALYHYQKTILNAYTEVANQLIALQSLEKTNALKAQQSRVLSQSVDTANELYKAARANYLEVLVAQQNALQANLDHIMILKQHKIATITIYKALGGGWR
ncbi:MAG: efflux transporter outer membrane subunit [Methylococcales bacterium]|nr:efflux transporter outer membrane subunit [Methylococcales bacterium]MDP3840380.1 efflux transporter outer membrane subunit [Methylococcales bacterium]